MGMNSSVWLYSESLWVAIYYDAHTSSLLKNIVYIHGEYYKNTWNTVAAKIK